MENNSPIPNIRREIAILRFTLIFVSFVMFSTAIQMAIFPAVHHLIFVRHWLTICVFITLGLIFLGSAWQLDKKLVLILNIFLLIIAFLLGLAMLAFYFNPLNVLMNFFISVDIALTGIALLTNLHLVLKKDLRNRFGKIVLKVVKPAKKYGIPILALIMIGAITASVFNWGYTITVKAPDDFMTTSSYWGPPRDDRITVTRGITPINSKTLLVNNSTLNETVDHMGEDSFCYAVSVTINGTGKNYCNYTQGAMSYPNGTVILSEPLESLSDVVITFVFRYNIKVFEMLGKTNATLIINYLNERDDFVYYPNIFMRIERTYLLQLFDWWGIKYYLDIGLASYSFPNVFNYPPFVELANQTIWWAKRATYGENGPKACVNMVGISADFEGGHLDNFDAYPLQKKNVSRPFGDILPYKDWASIGQQNQTLIDEAVQAWENVYDYCSANGYKFYAVFQESAMIDTIDGDLDYTHLPTFPISDNPDVLYGIMNYHDGHFEGGRFDMYKHSINQIKIYGEQGKTLLTGWIMKNTSYYTDDEIGLQRYIQDCLIAQAAGIVEIFHAPLYRMQGKWGNDTIMELHNALHNTTKQTFVLKPKVAGFEDSLMNDMLLNWGHANFAVWLWLTGIIYPYFLMKYYNKRNKWLFDSQQNSQQK